MDNHKLHLKIIIKSALVYKNPTTLFSKMCFYAVAAVVGPDFSSSAQRTMVDTNGGAKPFWLFPVDFQIDKYKLQGDQRWDTKLRLCIKCRRSKLPFDKTVVGKVHIPVKLLLDDYLLKSPGNRSKHVSFTVLSRSGNPRGVIYLSYSFHAAKEMNTSLRLLPPPLLPPRLVPSAPPLPEIENNGCNSQLLPTPSTPSAPYQSGKINSAFIIFLIFCLFICAFIDV